MFLIFYLDTIYFTKNYPLTTWWYYWRNINRAGWWTMDRSFNSVNNTRYWSSYRRLATAVMTRKRRVRRESGRSPLARWPDTRVLQSRGRGHGCIFFQEILIFPRSLGGESLFCLGPGQKWPPKKAKCSPKPPKTPYALSRISTHASPLWSNI